MLARQFFGGFTRLFYGGLARCLFYPLSMWRGGGLAHSFSSGFDPPHAWLDNWSRRLVAPKLQRRRKLTTKAEAKSKGSKD